MQLILFIYELGTSSCISGKEKKGEIKSWEGSFLQFEVFFSQHCISSSCQALLRDDVSELFCAVLFLFLPFVGMFLGQKDTCQSTEMYTSGFNTMLEKRLSNIYLACLCSGCYEGALHSINSVPGNKKCFAIYQIQQAGTLFGRFHKNPFLLMNVVHLCAKSKPAEE